VPERISVGWIDPEYTSGHFTHSIATQIRDLQYHDAAGRIFRHSASQPIVARNTLIREFLEEDDSPWLWMVDADMVFDKGHPMKLWLAAEEFGVQMVTGLAMIWKEGRLAVPSIFYRNSEDVFGQIPSRLPERGEVIAACGLASVLVHRDVFEAVQAPRHPDYRWFDFLPNQEVGINGDEMTGIDVQFFARATALDFKLIAEPEARTWHLEDLAIGHAEWEKQWASQSS
jgi:hypothetical protein